MQARNLFENTAWAERALANGTTLKLKLKLLEGGWVTILEYWRRARGADTFERVEKRENQTLLFEKLRLERSFGEVFGLGRVA